MRKSDLADKLNETFELENKTLANRMVNFFFDAIHDALVEGKDVDLARFGKFTTKERAAREGRNPQTGETIQIAATTVVNFRASKTLKDSVNGR